MSRYNWLERERTEMKKFITTVASLTLLTGVLAGCGTNDAKKEADTPKEVEKESAPVELTVSAAASLQNALEDLQQTYEAEHDNVTIVYNFGGSGALKQQIEQGAPVDVFFSAAEDKFDELVETGAIDKAQGTDLLANELVVVVPTPNEKNITSFEDLTKADKIALGTPESVPAGKYGVETLENMQLWEALEPKVVYAKDVRQVLTYTETENVDAGLVYNTDAMISDKVATIATAPAKTHTPIIYPVGVIKNTKHTAEAQDFYNFLQSEEAMKVFEQYGFKGAK